jgi:hypothetical protein
MNLQQLSTTVFRAIIGGVNINKSNIIKDYTIFSFN